MPATFFFAVNVTTPIFAIVLLGLWLRRRHIVSDRFVGTGSKIVFNVALPALLFVKLHDVRFAALDPLIIVYSLLAVTIMFIGLHVSSYLWSDRTVRGPFTQGAFRSNMGIIGLAFCLDLYAGDDTAIALTSIYLAVLTIHYNILATITLVVHNHGSQNHEDQTHQNKPGQRLSVRQLVLDILRNPLIVAISIALTFAAFQWPVHEVILSTGQYLAQLALPLALLCTGASIRWSALRTSQPLYWATLLKLVVVPAAITLTAYGLGFRGMELGILYLMISAPASAASYPMVRELGGDHELAAGIIASTNLFSIISTTVGIMWLQSLNVF